VEEVGVYADNTKMNIKKIAWEGDEWIHVPQNWDQWRAIVNSELSGHNFLE
jgi:hypothetical protein